MYQKMFLLRYSTFFGFLCYIAGWIWFLLLSQHDFNHRTYISENALLVGLVEDEFSEDKVIKDYYATLEGILSGNDSFQLVEWIHNEFSTIGLESAIHQFSLNYSDFLGKDAFVGRNVYGILRAPGGARTEAVVVAAPLRPKHGPEKPVLGSMAVMLALAKSFRRKIYWAKDIIFLFTDMEYVGLQAWLDAYHGTQTSRHVLWEELEVRSGSLQAGLSLELTGDQVSFLNLKVEGINGLLPNLDLVNIMVILAEKAGVQVRLQGKRFPNSPTSPLLMRNSLSAYLGMVWSMAAGSPTGLHGLLVAYQVPALTVEGSRMSGEQQKVSLGVVARVIEGALRSLNNLQERFHQSFFFYLLPHPHRYVSIGVYMPPFGLIICGLVLQVLAFWFQFSKSQSEQAALTTSSATSAKEGLQQQHAGDSARTASGDESAHFSPWWNLLPIGMISWSFGLLSYGLPDYFIRSSHAFRIDPSQGVLAGNLSILIALLLLPWLLRRKQVLFVRQEWRLLKCLTLLGWCLLFGCLSLLNISMALVLAAPLVPVILLVRPVSNRLGRALCALCLIAVSPLALLTVGCLLHTSYWPARASQSQHHPVVTCLTRCLLQSHLERELLGSWTYAIASLGLLPLWSLLWCLIWVAAG